MHYSVSQVQSFRFVDIGQGPVLFILHGLFGALSNFKEVITQFSPRFRVVIPILPLFDLEVKESTVDGLYNYVQEFVEYFGLKDLNLLGNSLGGHLALIYTLANTDNVKSLTLTGSSGLYENSIGDSYPKKGDYEFVKAKTEYTFYNPATATPELIEEVFEIVNNREKAIRVLYIARSAIRHNVRDDLNRIHQPTKLIWGADDKITPIHTAEEFEKLIPGSELNVLQECGHAPMMEHPHAFNLILDEFLTRVNK